MTDLEATVREKLARFDSATICNVIELLDVRARNCGFLRPPVQAMFPQLPPMVGYAVTATFRSATMPPDDEPALTLAQQVELFEPIPKPRVVVIQDLDDPPFAAVFGEVMTSTYKGFGCVGLVTNGYARDLPAIAEMNFPVFAAGVCVSHAYCRILEVGTAVNITGVTIRPGDLLHGDANGVTTIPTQIAEAVAHACEDFVAAEEVVISAARSGPDMARYKQAATEFMRRRDAIRQRLGLARDRATGV